ncbi:MAG: hypothetical protein LLF97_06810 [Planctomycetaceae bacterium]|nr:hypothetical protein [Planctomycetaceae bacterium]
MKKYYSLPEVVKLLGVSYGKVRYATLCRVVVPIKGGRSSLFSEAQLNTLKEHFAVKGVG